MTLADEAREAVRERPFLLEALRAGVVNHSAAARSLDLSGDTDAVATALRRYAERLPGRETERRRARVTMRRGIDPGGGDSLLSVDGHGFDGGDGDGDHTAVLATGDVDAAALSHALALLGSNGVAVEAAGVAGDALVVVVGRRDGPDALRLVERALEAVPIPKSTD